MRVKEGRMHIRVNEDLLRKVKAYVKRRNTTLTGVVEQCFKKLLQEEKVLRSMNPSGDDVEQV